MLEAPRRPDRRANLRRLLALARPEASLLVAATLALALGSGATLLAPQGIRALMDAVSRPDGRAFLDRAVLALLGVFVVMGGLGFVRAYLFTLAGERVVVRLRRRLFGRLIAQEVGFFDAQRTGDLLSRLSADTALLQSAVTVNVSMALRFCLQAAGSVAVLVWTSPRLTLVMLAVVPVVAVGAVLFARTTRALSRRVQDALAVSTATAEESLGNIRTVQSFAREKHEESRFGERIDEVYALGRRLALAYGTFQGAAGFAAYTAIALVLWYGGTLVFEGAMSVGDLTAFILYTLFLGIGLGGLSNVYSDFAKALGASERVFELIARDPGIPTGVGARPATCEARVRFEGVVFSYPTRVDAPVLRGLDLELEPGKVLALVGASGGGKSTVAALLSRFYDPVEGRVLLDGRDVRELDPDWLRQQVGMVAQEPVLFAATVADNIRYGRVDATEDEIRAAAAVANAHAFVSALPEGYATLVGERGVRLSGGQRQRIAIARAVLKDPRILVLDEATSALDAESEHLVQQALERLMAGRTVLVIAHRLSTVKSADRVVVIDRGCGVESGTHFELLRRDGLYRRLVERQFASTDPDSPATAPATPPPAILPEDAAPAA